MDVQRTVTVNRPIADVFDYLSDFENTNEWDPGTLKTQRLSGDGGLGTKYHNLSKFMGRKVTLTYEVVEHDRPNTFVVRGVNRKTTTFDRMSFTEDAGGTRIHYCAEFNFPFPLSLIAPLVLKRKLDELADETVEQIRGFLESGSGEG